MGQDAAKLKPAASQPDQGALLTLLSTPVTLTLGGLAERQRTV
jgi:hypothetical protein